MKKIFFCKNPLQPSIYANEHIVVMYYFRPRELALIFTETTISDFIHYKFPPRQTVLWVLFPVISSALPTTVSRAHCFRVPSTFISGKLRLNSDIRSPPVFVSPLQSRNCTFSFKSLQKRYPIIVYILLLLYLAHKVFRILV